MKKLERNGIRFYLLIFLVQFQGLSGIFGGAALVYDPMGQFLGLPLELLNYSPFETYLIPGLILFLILGVYPFIVSVGLWKEKDWGRWAAIVLGAALIIWIAVEIAMIGYASEPPLQLIYGIVGILIFFISLPIFGNAK